jgi:hypothetical protein
MLAFRASMRGFITILLLAIVSSVCSRPTNAADVCTPAGPLVPLPQLPEASGVALGRGDTPVLFAVNDSSGPVVTVLDRSGGRVKDLRVTGATITDWEDVTVASCDGGTCLYIADIGDNNRGRDQVRLYRVPEPGRDATATAPAEVINLKYPDGAHDAEAVFATAGGELFVVTKEGDGATLYRAPQPLVAGAAQALTRVGRVEPKGSEHRPITDADSSPDGRWVALRTNDAAMFYPTADLIAGRTDSPVVVSLSSVGEPQGEGIALGDGGIVYLVGEGGGDGRPGTFVTLRCTLPETRAR